jgi:hypothetical protein
MTSNPLGRLKRSMKEKCPNCGHTLQLRVREEMQLVRGEEQINEVEYIVCPIDNCEYEAEIKEPKKRVERFDKTKFVPEPKKERDNGGHKKRVGASENYARKSNESNRRRNQGNTKRI